MQSFSSNVLVRLSALVLAHAAIACDGDIHGEEAVQASLVEVHTSAEPHVTLIVENRSEVAVEGLLLPYTRHDDDGRVVAGGVLALPGRLVADELQELQVPAEGARPDTELSLGVPVPGGSAAMSCQAWLDNCEWNAQTQCEYGFDEVIATCLPRKRCSFTCSLPPSTPNPGPQQN